MTFIPNRGFTLIEAVVYFALLGLIMTGALLTTYTMLESAGKTSGSNTVEEEGNFVVRKIDWALNGSSATAAITAPAVGSYGSKLAVTRTDGKHILMRQVGKEIQISEDGGTTYLPITSSNTTVGSLQFYHAAGAGGAPEGVVASTTLANAYAATTTFSTTRYFRK